MDCFTLICSKTICCFVWRFQKEPSTCLREHFIPASTLPLATADWISGGKKTGQYCHLRIPVFTWHSLENVTQHFYEVWRYLRNFLNFWCVTADPVSVWFVLVCDWRPACSAQTILPGSSTVEKTEYNMITAGFLMCDCFPQFQYDWC